jgi:arginase family enzyme
MSPSAVKYPAKLFGVALDVSDDPFSLQLKLASLWARQQGQKLHDDPYEAIIEHIAWKKGQIEPAGKFPLVSWLGPRPKASDQRLVTRERMQQFLDEDGPLKTSHELRDFVADKILPGLPVMVGIDHSATGGVVSALSERLGPDNLTVLVLDRHFDALPLSVRMEPVLGMASAYPTGARDLFLGMSGEDAYCCGNFWAYLLDKGLVSPERMLFMGVADYPAEKAAPEWETFRERYLAFEERGCNFFPLREFGGSYGKRLERFLVEKIRTPYVYVSLDLDVGAYRCVHAARYMDGPGIEEKALLHIAHLVAKGCRSGKFRLAGLDVMEFNMHLLGITTEDGVEDATVRVARDFIQTLTLG